MLLQFFGAHGYWDGGRSVISPQLLGTTGLDRVPVEDRRARRVVDALASLQLSGIDATSGRLTLGTATPPEDGVRGGVFQMATIADLNQTISGSPTQAEVQAISDKIDVLLQAMRDAEMIAT